jgi:prenyltransferase beta subunit
MLDGSGARLAEGVKALVENKDKLKEFIKSADNPDGIFTAENLSSMLDGSGARLAEGVKALVENKDKLKEFIKSADNPDGIFTAENLASMLHGSGARLAEAIKAIHSRKEKLVALGKKYDPSSVSNQLNATAPGKRGVKIDAMYKTLESEIDGTHIPPDSGAKIAAANNDPQKVVGL